MDCVCIRGQTDCRLCVWKPRVPTIYNQRLMTRKIMIITGIKLDYWT